MEKLILVVALSGSAYLAVSGVWKVIKFFARQLYKHGDRKPTVVMPATAEPPKKDEWSEYEIPAFIRRGIPRPKLEPIPVKTKKRRHKARPDTPATLADSKATFEVVA